MAILARLDALAEPPGASPAMAETSGPPVEQGLAIVAQYLGPAQVAGAPPASIQTNPPFDPTRSDAICPVYPLETMAGVGGAAFARGVGAAIRAGVGAALRQGVPEGKPSLTESPAVTETSKAEMTAASTVSVRG